MLNEILTISGKPSLYKLLTRGRGALIVENIDETKKRLPIQGTDKVVSLGDISIFTDEKEMPLREVFLAIEAKYDKKEITFDWRKASNDQLLKFFGEIIPDFDRDRVYPSDIRKLVSWYNILIGAGITNFAIEDEADKPAEKAVVEEKKEVKKTVRKTTGVKTQKKTTGATAKTGVGAKKG